MRMQVCAWVVLVSGCASIGALQPAHTVGKRHFQVALESSEQAVVSKDTLTAYPMMGVAMRYGITESIDIGARIGPSGFEQQAKFELTPKTSRFIVSFAPLLGVTLSFTASVLFFGAHAALPILFGVRLGQRVQLIFSARVHDSLTHLSIGHTPFYENSLGLGGSAGVGIRVWRLWLIPELGVLQPFLITDVRNDGLSGTQLRAAKTTLQFTFSVTWDNA